LRKVPGKEDSPITIGRRVLSGREEGMKRAFLDVIHGRCLECEVETEASSSVWFSVDWSRSAERSEPKQHTVIVPCVAVQ
jgi:hypothetical protein